MLTTQSIAAQAFGKAVAAATAEGAKLAGKVAASAVLPGLLIEPITAALGAMVEVFVSKVFEETVDLQRQLDSKLETILSEPLESAKAILFHILQVEISNADTLSEIERQLNQSYDNLITALAYADKNDATAALNVLAYLALVAAMKRDGCDFARLHLKRLRRSASDLRTEHNSLEQRARELTEKANHENDLMELNNQSDQFWPQDVGISPGSRLAAIHARAALSLRSEAERLNVEAAEMRHVPEQMEQFCILVEAVIANRAMLLRLPAELRNVS
jgi:hypothetical protein